jgi:hypothetical protein
MGVSREGSLSQKDFPDLVQELQASRWTGLLMMTHRGVGRGITVQDGRMVFASSSSPDDRLGELLLRRGRITYRQFVEAGKAIAPGKRLGTILVEQGLLEPKDLVKVVVEHTQEIIYAAFQWTEGQYRLDEGQVSPEAITLNIRTPDLILEGIRRIEAWSRIERGLGGLEARYVRSHDADGILAQATTVSLEKRMLVEALVSPQTVEAICGGSSLGDFEACRTLWAFRVMGVAQRVDRPAPAKPMEDEGLDLVLKEE